MAKKFIELKKEIFGIEDIKETLKALEKISAANLHNLKIASHQMKEYEKSLKEIFTNLREDFSHPLFKKPKTKKKLKVLLGGEKGICGGLWQKLLDFFQENLKGDEEILILGEKTKALCQARDIKFNFFFPVPKEIPKEKDIKEIKDLLIWRFLRKEYREILIVWPSFESFSQQIPKETCFLPIDREKFEEELNKKSSIGFGLAIFEPSQKEVVDYLIKEYVGISFYQKVLETKLSELASRTLFTEDASEKASNLMRVLCRQYFRLKRELITKQIQELYSHRFI
jgi:ATP synthase F1 gamma subunit